MRLRIRCQAVRIGPGAPKSKAAVRGDQHIGGKFEPPTDNNTVRQPRVSEARGAKRRVIRPGKQISKGLKYTLATLALQLLLTASQQDA